jgi:hypothetical protein
MAMVHLSFVFHGLCFASAVRLKFEGVDAKCSILNSFAKFRFLYSSLEFPAADPHGK